MPDMVSWQRRRLIKSLACGWQCHEHPLSITAQHTALAVSVSVCVAGSTLPRSERPASRARPTWPVLCSLLGLDIRARKTLLALLLTA